MNDSKMSEAVMDGPENSGEKHKTVTPRIYVASLADYTAGRLLGRWIDASQSAKAIDEEIAALLAASPEPFAEEWAIHDYEGFGSYRLSESSPVDDVAEMVALAAERGPVVFELLARGHDLAEARKMMDDCYRGAYASHAECVEESIEDCFSDALNELPGFVRYHIDYAAIAHDFECSGDQFTIECDGMVHVFDNT
mgnify:CR=1 FL=1